MADRETIERSGRRARDRSMILFFVGVIILMSPVAGAALLDIHLLGLPVPLFYIFAAWGLLILSAAMLARPLREYDDRTAGPDNINAPSDFEDKASN